jgi:hypothetical protein
VLALNQQQFQDQLGVAIFRQQKQQLNNIVELVAQASQPAPASPPAGLGTQVDVTV